MAKKQILTWPQVEPYAHNLFNVWEGNAEMRWAEQSWGILEKAGLTTYVDYTEHYQVLFRLLALGGICTDFSDVMWDVTSDLYSIYGEVFDAIKFDRFIIGQMFMEQEEINAKSEEYLEALTRLIDAEREQVAEALNTGYGGAQGLYLSLWKLRWDKTEFTAEEELAALNEASDHEAIGWVMDGCPSYRWE